MKGRGERICHLVSNMEMMTDTKQEEEKKTDQSRCNDCNVISVPHQR